MSNFDSRPCVHCGLPETEHSGPPHQFRAFIPARRCPAANLKFPYHLFGPFGKPAEEGFMEEAERYWTERSTHYEPREEVDRG